jgi:hypothetical protein
VSFKSSLITNSQYFRPQPFLSNNRISSFSSSNRSHQLKEEDDKLLLTEEEQKVLEELEREEQELLKSQKQNRLTNLMEDDEDKTCLKLQESISEAYIPFENRQRIIQDVIDEIWNPAPQIEDDHDIFYQAPPEFLQRAYNNKI